MVLTEAIVGAVVGVLVPIGVVVGATFGRYYNRSSLVLQVLQSVGVRSYKSPCYCNVYHTIPTKKKFCSSVVVVEGF